MKPGRIAVWALLAIAAVVGWGLMFYSMGYDNGVNDAFELVLR
jgi:hypothetical protein